MRKSCRLGMNSRAVVGRMGIVMKVACWEVFERVVWIVVMRGRLAYRSRWRLWFSTSFLLTCSPAYHPNTSPPTTSSQTPSQATFPSATEHSSTSPPNPHNSNTTTH